MNNLPESLFADPVWHSLQEVHERFSLTYNNLKCYRPDYCPFGGYKDDNSISKYLDEYAKVVDNFFIVGEQPDLPQNLILTKELICLQMVVGHLMATEGKEEIVTLNESYDKELFEDTLERSVKAKPRGSK